MLTLTISIKKVLLKLHAMNNSPKNQLKFLLKLWTLIRKLAQTMILRGTHSVPLDAGTCHHD